MISETPGLTHVPQHLDPLGLAREARSVEQLAAREHFERRAFAPLERRGVLGAELDQQRRSGQRQRAPALGRAGHVPGRGHERRRDHQLGRARAGLDERPDGRGGGVDAVEQSE
jgi:hypothetical protein